MHAVSEDSAGLQGWTLENYFDRLRCTAVHGWDSSSGDSHSAATWKAPMKREVHAEERSATHVQPGAQGAVGRAILLPLRGCVAPRRLHKRAVPRLRRRRLSRTAQRMLTALVMQQLHKLRPAHLLQAATRKWLSPDSWGSCVYWWQLFIDR